jgi:peptidyl-prolyl cis-trans isomerase SurA
MKRIFTGLLAVALTCLLQPLSAKIGLAEVVDRIVAEVNDEIITMSELQASAKSIEAATGVNTKGKEGKEIERQMLEALIDRKLAKAEAKRRGMNIEDKEMETALANFKKKNNLNDDESFNRALNKAGLTLKELKTNIADQIIQQRLVTVAVGTKSVVSDADVRRVYEEHYKGGGSGAQMHLRIIKMPFPSGGTDAQKEELKKKAEAIVTEVKNGASFAEMGAKYSQEEEDAGFVSVSDLEPRLAEFLGRLKPKEVAPALTPEGIQLIQMVERRTGQAKTFEEAAPEIRQTLSQKELEKNFSVWVKTLREKAHIKIML